MFGLSQPHKGRDLPPATQAGWRHPLNGSRAWVVEKPGVISTFQKQDWEDRELCENGKLMKHGKIERRKEQVASNVSLCMVWFPILILG